MKIAFCSNFHGQGGTTSNVMAIANVLTMVHDSHVLLMQTHFDKNNLQRALFGISRMSDSELQFDNMGIDALLRYSKAGPVTAKMINDCSISINKQKMNFIMGTVKRDKDIYEQEMLKRYLNIIDVMNLSCDYLIIDTNSCDDEISQMILKEADLVVANLSQNINVIDEYLGCERYMQYISKTMFLIGNYNCNSSYNLSNIKRYSKAFTDSNIATIPYSVDYFDAQCDGKVLDFFARNIESKKGDSNYYFINSAKEAALLIMDKEFCCRKVV